MQEFALGDSNDYRVPDGGLHRYQPISHSRPIDLDPDELALQLTWPTTGQ